MSTNLDAPASINGHHQSKRRSNSDDSIGGFRDPTADNATILSRQRRCLSNGDAYINNCCSSSSTCSNSYDTCYACKKSCFKTGSCMAQKNGDAGGMQAQS